MDRQYDLGIVLAGGASTRLMSKLLLPLSPELEKSHWLESMTYPGKVVESALQAVNAHCERSVLVEPWNGLISSMVDLSGKFPRTAVVQQDVPVGVVDAIRIGLSYSPYAREAKRVLVLFGDNVYSKRMFDHLHLKVRGNWATVMKGGDFHDDRDYDYYSSERISLMPGVSSERGWLSRGCLHRESSYPFAGWISLQGPFNDRDYMDVFRSKEDDLMGLFHVLNVRPHYLACQPNIDWADVGTPQRYLDYCKSPLATKDQHYGEVNL